MPVYISRLHVQKPSHIVATCSTTLKYRDVQDIPGSLGPTDVASELGLSDIDTRPHRVQPVSAHQGVGIAEGLQWIVSAVKASPRLSLLRRRARGQA